MDPDPNPIPGPAASSQQPIESRIPKRKCLLIVSVFGGWKNALGSFVLARIVVMSSPIFSRGSRSQQAPVATPQSAAAQPDPIIKSLVDRLDLEKYKATIKGLTQFGDRRQGTDRNKAALDWIEAQLKSYGCTNTERMTYTYPSPAASDPNAPARGAGAGAAGRGGRGRGTGDGPAGSPAAATRAAGAKAAARNSAAAPERVSISQMRRAPRHSIRDCRR